MIKRYDVPFPEMPAFELLADGRSLLEIDGKDGKVLFTYDMQTNTGALFHLSGRFWEIWTPVLLDMFLLAMHSRGFQLPKDAEARAWLDAITDAAKPRTRQ